MYTDASVTIRVSGTLHIHQKMKVLEQTWFIDFFKVWYLLDMSLKNLWAFCFSFLDIMDHRWLVFSGVRTGHFNDSQKQMGAPFCYLCIFMLECTYCEHQFFKKIFQVCKWYLQHYTTFCFSVKTTIGNRNTVISNHKN